MSPSLAAKLRQNIQAVHWHLAVIGRLRQSQGLWLTASHLWLRASLRPPRRQLQKLTAGED